MPRYGRVLPPVEPPDEQGAYYVLMWVGPFDMRAGVADDQGIAYPSLQDEDVWNQWCHHWNGMGFGIHSDLPA